MRVFFDLRRDTGLTWLCCETPGGAPLEAAVRGTPAEFAAAIAECEPALLIGFDTSAKIKAIARALAALPPLAMAFDRPCQIDLGVAAPAPEESSDAAQVAQQYFSGAMGGQNDSFGGVLPAGCGPSAEQWDIIQAFERRQNIVCQAVAGAGKTTTLLLCAQRRQTLVSPEEGKPVPKGKRPEVPQVPQCVLLTYNKRLQLEVTRRLAKLRPKPNLVAYTYHGAAGKSYGGAVHNDETFRRVVRAAPENPVRFRTLMVDEAQDMSLEYYLFVRHLLKANPGAQLVVVGDARQAINEYRGARPEFLTEAEQLYAGLVANRGWAHRRLTVSQRLTPSTAAFVNVHLYGAQVITGGNRRDPDLLPRYVTARFNKMTDVLAREVKTAIAQYGPEGVFVLAASVRNLRTTSKSPLAGLVRRHLADVPVFLTEDDTAVDEELIRGKLAILSFNAAKGCERPFVVVVGLDESYFEYFDKEWADHRSLPNVLTVAATRASAQLVIIADIKTIRTVDVSALSRTAVMEGPPPRAAKVCPPKMTPRTTTVSDLTRHLHPETVEEVLALVSVLQTQEASVVARPMRKVQFGHTSLGHTSLGHTSFGSLVEDVGFAYGIIAPVLAELARTGETRFADGLETPVIVPDDSEIEPFSLQITAAEWAAYPDSFWVRIGEIAGTAHAERSAADWGRLAIARHAIYDGAHHLARQVDHYEWVSQPILESARNMILEALGDTPGEFEVKLPSPTIETTTIHGRADFIANRGSPHGRVIWEFKCTTSLTEAHVLQLACYLAMSGGGEGVLFNAYTGEKKLLFVESENAEEILRIVVVKARPVAISVFALIEQYDRRNDAGDTAVDETSGGSPPAFNLDDVF
jgi:hypothetical protein